MRYMEAVLFKIYKRYPCGERTCARAMHENSLNENQHVKFKAPFKAIWRFAGATYHSQVSTLRKSAMLQVITGIRPRDVHCYGVFNIVILHRHIELLPRYMRVV